MADHICQGHSMWWQIAMKQGVQQMELLQMGYAIRHGQTWCGRGHQTSQQN